MVEQIKMDDLAGQEGGPGAGAYSALPGLVRELIRTPAFKELLMSHLRDINPESARETIKAAVWEDVVFTMSALGAAPRMVNWLAEALVELGAQLNNFTLDILRDFLARLGQDFDVERLKSIPGAYAPMVDGLLLNDREALDGLIAALGSLAEQIIAASERTWRKVWSTADFGKIRKGVTAHLEERRAELGGPADIFNPVALSNLLGVVPALANFTLRVLTRAVQGMNLPAEILANAIFQLLEDIDMAEVGGLVNAMADFINALRHGDLVLGRDEPRFKAVFARVSRDLVDSVDGEAFKQMLIALKEDGAVIGSVLADYVYATPDNTVQLVRGLSLAVAASLRAAAETLRRFAEMPDDTMAAIADAYAEAVDPRELGRTINYGAACANRAFDARPDMLGRHLAQLLASLDIEELALAGKRGALQVKDAVLADPAVSALLEPESVAAAINSGLAAFNRFSRENPDLLAAKVAGTLNALDTLELGMAFRGAALPLLKAFLRDSDIVWNAVKPAAKVAAAAALALGGLAAGAVIFRRLRR